MPAFYRILPLLIGILTLAVCHKNPTVPVLTPLRIPGSFVYSIVQHADSVYFSTQKGEIYRFPLQNPAPLTRMGNHRTRYPLRTLLFDRNGQLYASSYETGVQMVRDDTLMPVPYLWRTAWAMNCDPFDNIWLAGRQGVFKDSGDTLIRKTDLHEAYDVDFYDNFLVVAHRNGITFFDTASGLPDTTFCKGVICWSLDRFDSLLVGGGVGTCALISGRSCRQLSLQPRLTIPWAAAQDTSGIIYLATQKGLISLDPHHPVPRIIACKDSCVKSVLVDSRNRLWIGEYF